jgi:hypothetical protein
MTQNLYQLFHVLIYLSSIDGYSNRVYSEQKQCINASMLTYYCIKILLFLHALPLSIASLKLMQFLRYFP